MTEMDPSPSARPEAPFADLRRHGAGAVIILCVLLVAGFALRADRVFSPHPFPGDDALAYRALAESLYEEGTYGGPGFRDPSDWSPGAPLLFAAGHFVAGGVNDGIGRGMQALLGTAAILIVFLIASRLDHGPVAPLVAAGLVAFYPPFIHSIGSLMSEPAAIFFLPAAVLGVLWADSRRGRLRTLAWTVPGLLLGITCLIRPEYLFVALVMIGVVGFRRWLVDGPGRGAVAAGTLLLAVLVPILPWTYHNLVTLDRVVPITTGSGKALFVGTYLPADGEYQRVKADLLERFEGIELAPGSAALDRVDPAPLFDRVAAQYPGAADRDAALSQAGRENLSRYLRSDPVGYFGMLVRKGGRMWGSGIGEAMSSPPGRAVQIVLVLAGLTGAIILGRRRRWEVIPVTVPMIVVSAIAVLTLAPPRRNEVLMTLVLVLVGVAAGSAERAITRFRTTEGAPSWT